MSVKSTIARCAGTAVAAAGVLALALPGIASAAPTAEVPAPKISAHVDGDAIDMTIARTGAAEGLACLPVVLSATDALPLAATPMDQWPSFLELLDNVYYVGNATYDGAPVESTTALDENDFNPGLLKPITPGAYAVVGACFDATAQDEVLSYSYQVVFFPGGVGSLGQALDLGSATIGMDGGSAVIADLLKSGAGSSMLSANMS